MVDFNLLAQSNCSVLQTDSAVFTCEIGRVVNIMAWISLPIAIGSVLIIGLILIGSVTNSNAAVAASTLKRVVLIGVGLVVVLNAPSIARIVI